MKWEMTSILNYWFDVTKFRLVKRKSQPFLFTISSRSLNSSSLIFQLDILSSLIFGKSMNFRAVSFVNEIGVLPRTSNIFNLLKLFFLKMELMKLSFKKMEKFPSRLIHSMVFTPKFQITYNVKNHIC